MPQISKGLESGEDHTRRIQQSHPMSEGKGLLEGRGCWKADAVVGEEPRRGQGQKRGLEWEGRRWDYRWAGPRASGEAVPNYLRTCSLGEPGLRAFFPPGALDGDRNGAGTGAQVRPSSLELLSPTWVGAEVS